MRATLNAHGWSKARLRTSRDGMAPVSIQLSSELGTNTEAWAEMQDDIAAASSDRPTCRAGSEGESNVNGVDFLLKAQLWIIGISFFIFWVAVQWLDQ
jgi:hypothetical protein